MGWVLHMKWTVFSFIPHKVSQEQPPANSINAPSLLGENTWEVVLSTSSSALKLPSLLRFTTAQAWTSFRSAVRHSYLSRHLTNKARLEYCSRGEVLSWSSSSLFKLFCSVHSPVYNLFCSLIESCSGLLMGRTAYKKQINNLKCFSYADILPEYSIKWELSVIQNDIERS